jgi:cytidylate kinase
MILAIGGPPGSGKTTVAERWANLHGFALVSAGQRFRSMARQRGMSLEAFGRAAEKDPSIDRALDTAILAEVREKASAGANVVVDGRIQAHLLARERIPSLKVLIDAPLDVRAERIARREKSSVADAKREIHAREASERIRYKAIYGIDLKDASVFDLVIDSRDKTPDEIVSLIAARVRE